MANLGLRGIFGNKQVLFVVGVALLAVFAINYFSSISGAATSNPLVEVVYPNGGEIVSGKIVLKASTSATSPYSEIKESTVQTIQSDGTVYPYYNKAGTGWLLADWPELPDGGMYLETGGFPDGNYKLLITVIDNNGQTYTDTSDGWFTIKNTLDCTDSDSTPESFSSNDPSLLVKGTTSSAGESKIDYCASLSKIIEHSCSQGYVFADEMTCPSGYSCADGACKQQQQQESLSPTIDLSADKNTAAIGEQIKISYKITDPDYVSGDLKYAISEGYIGQLQTSPTNTVQQGTVSKELSTTPFSKSGTWKYIVSVTDPQKLGASKAITITVSSVCTPGAKQCEGSNLKTCKADGSGWDTTACTNGCSATKLVCMNCVPNLKWCEGSYLKTCGSDGFGVSGTLCSNGCDATNKICKPAPQVCVDSDGGNDQYKKGTCTSSGIKAEDMCSRPNTLEETRCVVPPYGGESRCESMFIACPNGCQDGVCKQSGGITGTRSAKSCEFSWPQKIVYSDGSKKECSYIRSTTNKYAKPYCNYPKAQQGIAQCCQWTKSKSYYNCVAM